MRRKSSQRRPYLPRAWPLVLVRFVSVVATGVFHGAVAMVVAMPHARAEATQDAVAQPSSADVPPAPEQEVPAPPPADPSAEVQPETVPDGAVDGATRPDSNAEIAPNPLQNPKPPQTTFWVAHLLRRKTADQLIKGLNFAAFNLPVVLQSSEAELKPTVTIQGRFVRPGWAIGLMVGKNVAPLTLRSDGSFELHLYLKGRVNDLGLIAKGPGGVLETEHIYIYSPAAMQFHVVSPWNKILLSTGLSFFDYQQSSFGEYQSISGLISAQFQSALGQSKWGIWANANMTVVTLASSPTANGPQTLEAKLDLTYHAQPSPNRRWESDLMGGVSYLTMFAYGSPFGFADLTAPEIGYRGKYIVNSDAAWFGEARYVALASLINFTQYGLDFGIFWSKQVLDSNRVEAGLTWTSYAFQPASYQNIRLNLVCLRLGISI